MNIAAISFTDAGEALASRIAAAFSDVIDVARCPEGGLSSWTEEHFASCDALIFVSATGIAVRAIAPFVSKKTSDPAVVVIDEQGKFAISLLSGHIGGANLLAQRVAKACDAMPVITTATDVNGMFSVDSWATQHGYAIMNPGRIKTVSGALLAGNTVHLITPFEVEGELPLGLDRGEVEDAGDPSIEITWKADPDGRALLLVPRCIVAGIGCRKGMSVDTIEDAYREALAIAGCSPMALWKVASIDIKQDERGIVEFAQRHGVNFETHQASELGKLEGTFSASGFVNKTVGVNNVCERAAVLSSGGGQLVLRKYVSSGVTVAFAAAPFVIDFKEQ